jgi:hypothetical protein
MAKVDMKAWYEENALKLEQLKEQFVAAMLAEEDFFDIGGEDYKAVYDHDLKFRPQMLIALDRVDDLKSELGKADFDLPNKPSEMDPDNIERHKRHVFDDSRLDGFEAKLKSVYDGFKAPTAYQFSNQSLEEAIQSAFYDYQYHRDLDALEGRIDDIAAQWAADGYEMAPGSMGNAIAEEANAFDRKRSDQTQGVFGDLAQTVQQNIQWSIENGFKIEDLHMDFAIKYSELSKVFIQSSVDAYIAEIEKRLAEQRAQIDLIKAQTKSMDLDVKADITKHKLELSERTARLAAYTQATNTFMDTEAGSIIEELKLAANIAEGYGGIFSSYGSLFTGISYEE